MTEKKQKKNCRIVGIGGGTGLATLLTGLKDTIDEINAVVAMTDDGGSSGRLRREFNIPPPGDIRNCLVALANTESSMSKLFQYRFLGSKKFGGHSFGNLFIMAMAKITGSFEEGVREASKILRVKGRVIPSTLKNAILGAKLSDGTKIFGQTKILRSRKKIKRVFLKPKSSTAAPNALEAIKNADGILLGPGSLYTSIIPNLLVGGIAAAVSNSRAIKIYILNIMTQPEETDNYSASRHLKVLLSYLPGKIDYILINTDKAPGNLLKRYAKNRSYPILIDNKNLSKIGINVVKKKMVSKRDYARHNPKKLARAILELI